VPANALLCSIDILCLRIHASRPDRIEFMVGTQITWAPTWSRPRRSNVGSPRWPPGLARTVLWMFMYRVFLSHTSELRRFGFMDAAEDALRRAECLPIDMEYFAARDQAPAEYCAEQVAGADVYVGIIGFRYGSLVPDKSDVSHTEHEFDTATRLGKTRLMFLLDTPRRKSCRGLLE
jgi:Domain of unknown function (DUF4062)